MPAPPPRKLRPELPEGPFLVVGLARSGWAVARLLAELGGDVTGSILGIPMGLQGFGRLVSKSFWMQTDLRSSTGSGPW